MMSDPFEQFERSRSGLVIPLVLILAGAVPTALAMRAMISLRADQAAVDQVDAANPPDADQSGPTTSEPSQNSQDKSDP